MTTQQHEADDQSPVGLWLTSFDTDRHQWTYLKTWLGFGGDLDYEMG